MNHSSCPIPFRGPRDAIRAGFTLIEMLIVIGIVVVLAGLLLPVFHAARNSGEARACSSNMHQLGLGFQQYTQDFGNCYPNAGNFQNWHDGSHWVSGVDGENIASLSTFEPVPNQVADVTDGALFNYVKSAQVYICPANSDGEIKGLSYSMNCALAQLNTVRVRAPSEIVLLVDEDKANDGYFWAINNPDAGDAVLTSTDALTQLHNGGGNLLFCDGHVKLYLANEFPLNTTSTGMEDKWRETGIPRFHDAAFGPYGSYFGLGRPQDSCNATARIPGT